MMCGILFMIINNDNDNNNEQININTILNKSKIRQSLKRRGPDYYQSIEFIHHNENLKFHLESSVLHLRGQYNCYNTSKQPYYCDNNQFSYLQWNGQIYRFSYCDNKYNNFLDDDSKSDTEILFNLLLNNNNNNNNAVIKTLSSIHGPWSMTFWDGRNENLWIARDLIGRRSLCWNKNLRDKILIITSVAYLFDNLNDEKNLFLNSIEFEEIPTDRIFCFNLNQIKIIENIWLNVNEYFWPKTIAGFNVNLNDDCKFISTLSIISKLNMEIPTNEIDRLLKLSNIIEDDNNDGFKIDEKILENFLKILSESIKIRCNNQQNLCKNCCLRIINGEKDIDCQHTTVAILFSGGLDSLVLARIADHCIEPKTRPIDLLNVSFDCNSSDRNTGLIAWNELCELCPKRQWNFIEIDVDRDELEFNRKKYIHLLLDPNCTIMDDSIGSAIWFAARGEGLLLSNKINNNNDEIKYKCPARVVLLGMGSDEQLGGYSRHRKAFKNGDWMALLNEIRIDIERISKRNLGRDDRIISDHSIDARYPYLDEKLINFLNTLPIWQKCNLYLKRGYGEKWLLRIVAKNLGLKQSCFNLKRAIQFGTKITNYQNNHSKGYDLYEK